jgi:homoserine dehydrogenase
MSGRETIRLGLLGCGTVGTGVLRLLSENGDAIAARLGCRLEVTRILVQDLERERDPSIDRELLTTDASDVLDAADVDVVAEVMGGYEPARTHVLAALAAGKHVVTANKALLARHGLEIFAAATEAKRDVIFEASVGGAMPVVRTLREGLSADRVDSIHTIINGTSNFILSAMSREGADYGEALAQAQDLGYAEADPVLDVGGGDAAQKLSILISLAFGSHVPFDSIPTQGIDTVKALDIRYAREFGYGVKPLALARLHDDGIEARVHPALVPLDGMLASVHEAYNAVRIQSRAMGPLLLQGQGAGMLPTASAVVSDAIELGRNLIRGTSGRIPHLAFEEGSVPAQRLRDPSITAHPWYLRFPVTDAPGVLGGITKALGDAGVSIARLVQDRPVHGAPVQVVMLTHTASAGAIEIALEEIARAPWCQGPAQRVPVEEDV